MRLSLTILAATSLALGGCASTQNLASRVVGPTGPEDAPRYLAAATASNQYGIQAAQVALSRAERREVRALAEQFLKDNTLSAGALAQAAASYGLTLPVPALTSSQQSLLGSLHAPAGSFDATYLQQQVPAHEAALRLHHAYALSGDSWLVRDVAANSAGKTFQNLDLVKRLLRTERGVMYDRIGYVAAARKASARSRV